MMIGDDSPNEIILAMPFIGYQGTAWTSHIYIMAQIISEFRIQPHFHFQPHFRIQNSNMNTIKHESD